MRVPAAVRLARVVASILLVWFTAFPLLAQNEPYFEEGFESPTEPDRFEGWENFEIADGVLKKNWVEKENFNDRRYLRTVVSDYHRRDFVFEVTISGASTPGGAVVFAGLGHGDWSSDVSYHEPKDSLFFRIHTPNVIRGEVHVWASHFGQFEKLGNIEDEGPHRVRIEKVGNRLLFALDKGFDGEFRADIQHVIDDISVAAPYLTGNSSHLFIGTRHPLNWFDDIVVRNPSDPDSGDCNQNLVPDATDIETGTSQDIDSDGIPDECQGIVDCNDNGIDDSKDISNGAAVDCNKNGVPDGCEIAMGSVLDLDGNGVPDECDRDESDLVIEIQALIDGHDRLLIRNNTLRWHHLPDQDAAAVGRHGGRDVPTTITTRVNGEVQLDGVEWYPQWPLDPPDQIRFEAFSSVFDGFLPPLACDDQATIQLIRLTGRREVSLLEEPNENNDYTPVQNVAVLNLSSVTPRGCVRSFTTLSGNGRRPCLRDGLECS